MHTSLFLRSVKQRIVIASAGVLLLCALFASLGAGPDEPKASNVNDNWEIFEGHAYADNRAAPAGVSLDRLSGRLRVGLCHRSGQHRLRWNISGQR